KAVEVIQKGEIWIQRTLIPGLILALRHQTKYGASEPDAAKAQIEALTLRQRLVADLIRMGASNKEISSQLNISERTVKAHLTEVFRALGVPDRLHLALVLNGRMEPPSKAIVTGSGLAGTSGTSDWSRPKGRSATGQDEA